MRFVVTFVICCFSTIIGFAQYDTEALFVITAPNKKLTYKNLQLYPILAKDNFKLKHKHIGVYVGLKQALEEPTVMISENGGEHKVEDALAYLDNALKLWPEVASKTISHALAYPENNKGAKIDSFTVFDDELLHPEVQEKVEYDIVSQHLVLHNKSNDTIFIMAGEIIRGGQYDRIVARDMLIVPKRPAVDLPVFCIEKNRWQYNENGGPQFLQYGGMASIEIRQAVQGAKSQSTIWELVDRMYEKYAYDKTTHAYSDVLLSNNYQKDVEGYFKYLNEAFNEEVNVVGLVVVSGKEVVACDVFANTALFQESYKVLLASYVNEAVIHGSKPTLSATDVETYFQDLLNKKNEQVRVLDSYSTSFAVNGSILHLVNYIVRRSK